MEEKLKIIEAAKELSLKALLNENGTPVKNDESKDIKMARVIALEIDKVPQICSSGKKSIVKIFNIFREVCCNDKIAEIKEEYLPSMKLKAPFYSGFTVLVPIVKDIGWRKDQPILLLSNELHFLRATGTTAYVDWSTRTAYSKGYYRLATKEEINSFYDTLIATTKFSGKISPKLVIPK